MTRYTERILKQIAAEVAAAEQSPELAYRALEAKLRPPVVTKKAA